MPLLASAPCGALPRLLFGAFGPCAHGSNAFGGEECPAQREVRPEQRPGEQHVAQERAAEKRDRARVTIREPLERIAVGQCLFEPAHEVADQEKRQARAQRGARDAPDALRAPKGRPAEQRVAGEVHPRQRVWLPPVRGEVDREVFEGDGRWREYEGGVDDWLTQSRRAALWSSRSESAVPNESKAKVEQKTESAAPAEVKRLGASATRTARKLSYKEQRELEGLPVRLEALEREQLALRQALADPAIYTTDPLGAARMHERDAAIEDELMQCLERWEELSS